MRPIATSAACLAAFSGLASAQTVYTNGPLSTGATNSAGAPAPAGYTWSEMQDPNTSLGFNAQRFADDATLAASIQIQSIDVFAYITNTSTTSSPFNTATLRIWNGPPDEAASVVVFGNTTTNRFLSATPVAIHRTHYGLAETNHVIWQIRLACVTNLAAGTYWIDWSLNAGNFPAVTIAGSLQKPGANAMHFQTSIGFWRNVQDGATLMAQDLPFAINGTGGGGGNTCFANCDHSTALPFLNVADFTCFLQQYAAGATYANCDSSTTAPVLNVADFTCFLQKYAAGCSAP